MRASSKPGRGLQVTLADRIERALAAGEALADLVRQSVPETHHRLCMTAQGGECDCYMSRYSDERAALASWQEAREMWTR